MTAQYYFVFNSRSQAIYMESMLKQKGYSLELRPTPGKLGKSCNSSLVAWGDLMRIKHIRDQILGYRMSIKGVYKASKIGHSINYTKVF